MRPQPENDLVYLLMILESIGKIKIYSNGFKQAIRFFRKNDQINFNTSLLLLANIGEQAGRISEAIRVKYSKVLWRQIKDFHNRIVHDYRGIDYEMTFDIIKSELPATNSHC